MYSSFGSLYQHLFGFHPAASVFLRTTSLLFFCGVPVFSYEPSAVPFAVLHHTSQSRFEIPLSCSILQVYGGSFLPGPQVFPAARNWIKCHLLGSGQWCTERSAERATFGFPKLEALTGKTCLRSLNSEYKKKISTRRCDTFTQASRTQF